MVRRSFLTSQRDVVKRFVRAYSEAIYEFKSDKEKGIKVYARHLKQTDQTILEETYNYYAPRFSFPPRIDQGGINNALGLVRGDAKGKEDVNLAAFVDESLLDELEREGFFKNLAKSRRLK
jgi:ABC-type nitrate/sulfonate/bicarbonate transport system substrate-binding protein